MRPNEAVCCVLLLIGAIGCSSGSTAPIAAVAPGPSVREILVEIEALGTGGAVSAEQVGALCRLASREDWRRALRAIDLSEAEFVHLPAGQRDARRQADLDRVGALRRLGRAAVEEARRLRSGGRDADATEIETCVERLVSANSGPSTLAVANLVAQAIARDLAAARAGS